VPIREGLARLDGVAFISKHPDVKAGTCELRLEHGRFMDPLSLSNHVYNIRVGARVRGVEATIVGLVERDGTNFVCKVAGTSTLLTLAPLSRKVQNTAKQPQPPTPREASAFSRLTKKFKKPRLYAVTGPLRQGADGSLILEVRDVAGARTSSSAATRAVSNRL
jgi:hypothetical protein